MVVVDGCPFCHRAIQLLVNTYKVKPVLEVVPEYRREARKKELFERTQQKTFPYIFLRGQFIGGASDLEALHQRGTLKKYLA